MRKLFCLISLVLFFNLVVFAQELITDGIVKKDLHLKPDALVSEYIKRDSEGEFLQTNEWWNSAVACPDCMGGPDEFTVISYYKIKKISKLKFSVKYEIEGKISIDTFTPGKKTEEQTVSVVKTKWGFKLHTMPFQMVKAETALKRFESNLNQQSKDLLRAISSKVSKDSSK